MMTRKALIALGLVGAVILASCGGRAPNPVSQYQPGDEDRSCDGLRSEIAMNEAEIAKLAPHEDATGKNVALGVAGAFLLVPWFFMDFKDGEGIDLKALQRRNQWLHEVAVDRGCKVPPPQIEFEHDAPASPTAPGARGV